MTFYLCGILIKENTLSLEIYLLQNNLQKSKQCFIIQTLVFICKGFSVKAKFVLGILDVVGQWTKFTQN